MSQVSSTIVLKHTIMVKSKIIMFDELWLMSFVHLLTNSFKGGFSNLVSRAIFPGFGNHQSQEKAPWDKVASFHQKWPLQMFENAVILALFGKHFCSTTLKPLQPTMCYLFRHSNFTHYHNNLIRCIFKLFLIHEQ